jgi:hypothetical protein
MSGYGPGEGDGEGDGGGEGEGGGDGDGDGEGDGEGDGLRDGEGEGLGDLGCRDGEGDGDWPGRKGSGLGEPPPPGLATGTSPSPLEVGKSRCRIPGEGLFRPCPGAVARELGGTGAAVPATTSAAVELGRADDVDAILSMKKAAVTMTTSATDAASMVRSRSFCVLGWGGNPSLPSRPSRPVTWRR